MGAHRYSLQRYGTWEWLDYDAFLVSSDGPEWARNAYGLMRATVPAPAAHRLIAEDGRDLFEEWGTFVHYEIDSPGLTRREWTGIITEATLGPNGWDLVILEHPGYLKGTPYEGLIRGVRADPAAMLRQLVTDVQAWRNAWYGCTVNGSTPVRLGSDLDDRIAAARAVMDARRRTLDSFSKTSRITTISMQDDSVTLADEVARARVLVVDAQNLVTQLTVSSADPAQIEQAKATLATRRATYNSALAAYNAEIAAGRAAVANARRTKDAAQVAYDRAKASYDALKDQQRDGNGAYVVDGTELPDAYKVLQDICDTAGIEWTTSTVYTTGAPQVAINVHYPSAGTRRDDLVFDTAVNIIGALELERLEYANAAAGIGAGEGSKAIRETMSVPTQRMRRATTVEDKSATSRAQIQARLRRVLASTTGELFPHSIEVREHPNCRIGSWRVGDLITVSGVTTIGSTWSGLARIESWSRPSENRALIQLEPA